MSTSYEIKGLIQSMADAMCNIVSLVGTDMDARTVREGISAEIMMFLSYLSASDGEISWKEATTLSDWFDLNLTPQSLSDFIRNNNIYSVEFENKVPGTLEALVDCDNYIIQNGFALPDAPALVVNAYREIGSVFIREAGSGSYNEESDLSTFINTLERYIRANSVRQDGEVTGFTKSGGGVSAPTKSGVTAPKKKV